MITKYKIFENTNDPKNLIGKIAISNQSNCDVYLIDKTEKYIHKKKSNYPKDYRFIIDDTKKLDGKILLHKYTGKQEMWSWQLWYDMNDFNVIDRTSSHDLDPYDEEDWLEEKKTYIKENVNDPKKLIGEIAILKYKIYDLYLINSETGAIDDKYKNTQGNPIGHKFKINGIKMLGDKTLIRKQVAYHSLYDMYYDLNDFKISKPTELDPYGEEDWDS